MKLRVPTSWNDISVKQFQDYIATTELATTTEEKIVAALTILCGMQKEDVHRLTATDMMRLMKLLAFIDSDPASNTELVQRFKLHDIEFGFIPNWTHLTLGEYVDLETYTSQHNFVTHLHKAMALMYRPITSTSLHQYEIAPYAPNVVMQKAMEDAPMNVAVSAVVFFYNIGSKFARDMQHYLRQSKGNNPTTHSGLNGVGTE